MTESDYLREVEQRARRFSGAWTGTSGTLAADCMRLLKMIKTIKEGEMSDSRVTQVGGMPPEALEQAWSTHVATTNTGQRVLERTVYGIDEPPQSHALGDEIDEYGGDPPPVASRALDPANPKDLVGSLKLPLHLWPATATAEGCIALHNGAEKYGRANWRAIPVRASIYYAALLRHMAAWFDGEEVDEEGVRHLGSALACLAILADAQAAGTMVDDRNLPGGLRPLVDRLTPQVSVVTNRLRTGAPPRHYTIADTPAGSTGTKVH